jgi:hypothetical protein
MLTFHAVGDWGPGQVSTTFVESTRRIVPEVESIIEATWAATVNTGRFLFDGPMCRVESWQADQSSLRLVLSTTSYKPFWGTNLSHPELVKQYGRAVMANPLGVSPALETADGFLLFGRRNAKVAYYPSRVHPFAGCAEPPNDLSVPSVPSPGTPGEGQGGGPPDSRSRIPDGKPQAPPPQPFPGVPEEGEKNSPFDVFSEVRRELREELGLTADDLNLIRCTGLVEDAKILQPEIMFRVTTRLTREQVERALDAAEHHATFAVPATVAGVEAALANPELTPVACAALLLWGRAKFSGSWFAQCAGPKGWKGQL